MNDSARRENNRSLAEMIGASEDEAATLLNIAAGITYAADDEAGAAIAGHVKNLLSRTLTDVAVNRPVTDTVAVELVVGVAARRHGTKTVWLSIEGGRAFVTKQRGKHENSPLPPIGRLLAACYACAAVLKEAIGDRLPYPVPESYIVDLRELLGGDVGLLDREVDFDEAFLAGAGAIGNGFVLGLAQLPVTGKLHIVDDDHASDGNLQRCTLFTASDVGSMKADVLAAVGTKLMPKVACVPHKVRLQQVPQRKSGAWLRRLIVAVDSPRARRNLQNEMPREVFDASTTGAAEIVFHYHVQPTEQACMACVYPQNPDEDAHEKHVAESLGVTVEEARELKISHRSADKVLAKYPHLSREVVVGTPYDTLFKALCSSSKLFTAEGRDVLTPFAFVSVLAGALLALEFFRRVSRGHNGLPNLWRVSPWSNPLPRCRRTLSRNPDCDFCSQPVLQKLIRDIWAPKENSTR